MAWDTSTDVVTVAVHDGQRVVGHRTVAGGRQHAEVLTPLVANLLAGLGAPEPARPGDVVDRIVAGVGPGAYTGLRVGLVTADALALAWGVPAQGACSLDALAVQAVAEHPARVADGLLVVTDARRGQVFWARYDPRGARVAGPAVAAPHDVPHADLPSVGGGALGHREVFVRAFEPSHPDAGWLASGLVDGVIAAQPLVPIYLRQPDVTLPAGGKPVLQPGRGLGGPPRPGSPR